MPKSTEAARPINAFAHAATPWFVPFEVRGSGSCFGGNTLEKTLER